MADPKTNLSALPAVGTIATTDLLYVRQGVTDKKGTVEQVQDLFDTRYKQAGANETANVSDASTTAKGIIEIATQGETDTGTDNARAVTPLTLKNWAGNVVPATTSTAGKVELATQVEVDEGTDATRAVTPSTLKNWSGFDSDLPGFNHVDGYFKFPGGFTIQWGRSASIGDAGSATITLPLAFTYYYGLQLTPNNQGGSHAATGEFLDAQHIKIYHYDDTGGASSEIHWLAYGKVV